MGDPAQTPRVWAKPKDKSFFLAVNDLLRYREMLPESLEASLHELGGKSRQGYVLIPQNS